MSGDLGMGEPLIGGGANVFVSTQSLPPNLFNFLALLMPCYPCARMSAVWILGSLQEAHHEGASAYSTSPHPPPSPLYTASAQRCACVPQAIFSP